MWVPLSRRGTTRAINSLRCWNVQRRWKKSKAKAKTELKPDRESVAEDVDLSEYQSTMKKTVEAFQRDLATIRTSGANPNILDNVKVEAYGATTALRKVAQVSVRDARSLIVTVFDNAITKSVEKSIRNAGLNLNPQIATSVSGRITVPVPKPTKESREEMKKVAMRDAENARVAARNIRRSAMQAVRSIKSSLSKDEVTRLEKEVQSSTDESIESIDNAISAKLKAIEAP